MTPSTATVTGPTGPASTVTAQVINNVREFHLSLDGKSFMEIINNLRRYEFDINATTTMTVTIASGVATITVSQ